MKKENRKFIIFYFSENDKKIAEILRAMIYNKDQVRCEVRNVSYLGDLSVYDLIILCSIEANFKLSHRIHENYNGRERWYHKVRDIEKFSLESYKKFYPGKNIEDYYEFIAEKTIPNLL